MAPEKFLPESSRALTRRSSKIVGQRLSVGATFPHISNPTPRFKVGTATFEGQADLLMGRVLRFSDSEPQLAQSPELYMAMRHENPPAPLR